VSKDTRNIICPSSGEECCQDRRIHAIESVVDSHESNIEQSDTVVNTIISSINGDMSNDGRGILARLKHAEDIIDRAYLDISRLDREVFGNSVPGLDEKVRQLYCNIERLKSDIEDIKRSAASKEEQIDKKTWAVIFLAIGSVLSLIARVAYDILQK